MRALHAAVLAGLALMATTGARAAADCTLATDSVAPPSGGFIRTIYNVDFEEPVHYAGNWPTEGLGPEEVGLYTDWPFDTSDPGLPKVVTQPLLDSQSAELNARPQGVNDVLDYDDMDFRLRRAADYYEVDFDLVIDQHTNLTRTLISVIDSDLDNCSVVFDADGDIYMSQNLAQFQFDTRYHVSMTLVPNSDGTGRIHFTLSRGETEVYSGQFILNMATGVDFSRLRLRGQGYEYPDQNYAQVDNMHIRAGYTELPNLPAADDDGLYRLDYGTDHGSLNPEDGFVTLFALHTSDITNDGTPVARFSLTARPMITHQLGLPFTLKSIDLGEYSTSSSTAETITITGHRYDDTTISTSFTTDGIADGPGGTPDFQELSFDDQWTDLRAITLAPSKFSIDDVVLSVDTDIDGDGVHDWPDACLPDEASTTALTEGKSDNAGCPLERSNSGAGGGGLPTLLLITLMIAGGARRGRTR